MKYTPGQLAYQAHRVFVDAPLLLLPWDQLTEGQRRHWEQVGSSVFPFAAFRAWLDAKSAKSRMITREAFLAAMKARYDPK